MTNPSNEHYNATFASVFYLCVFEKGYGYFICYFIMSLCVLVGMPAHLWWLRLYVFNGKNIQTRVFLMNNTIMDFLSCTEFAVEMLNAIILPDSNFFLFNAFLFGLSWTGRPLIQTCICIEQYFAVIHPITFLKYKGTEYRIAAVAAAWLVAFGYGLYEVYFTTVTDLIFNAVFIVSVVVMSYCCVSVLCVLKHPGPRDSHITTQEGRDIRNQTKRNAFNVIFSVLLIFLLTYIPQTFLTIFTVLQIHWGILYCNVVPLINSLCMFTLIITPLLRMNKKRYLKKYLKCRN